MPIGRHQSTCKDGRRSLLKLEALAGVRGVVLGQTSGRRTLGRALPVGWVKLQRRTGTAIKGQLLCSYGCQDITLLVEPGSEEAVEAAVHALWPS